MIHIMSHKTISGRWVLVAVVRGNVTRLEIDGFQNVQAELRKLEPDALRPIDEEEYASIPA